jgi:hypothetical protein
VQQKAFDLRCSQWRVVRMAFYTILSIVYENRRIEEGSWD